MAAGSPDPERKHAVSRIFGRVMEKMMEHDNDF